MNQIEIALNIKFDDLISQLEQAVKEQNKQYILACFEEINVISFDLISKKRLKEYDNLIKLSNDILYK